MMRRYVESFQEASYVEDMSNQKPSTSSNQGYACYVGVKAWVF